jgi:hypothetical protein
MLLDEEKFSSNKVRWCRNCQKEYDLIRRPPKTNMKKGVKTFDYKLYCIKNREEINRKNREYYHKNKDKVREHQREYERNKRKSDINYKLKKNISTSVCNQLKKRCIVKDMRTKDLIGVSVKEIREHLESKFQEGMSWENYGEWHIDHIKPQSSFDFNNKEEIKECWKLSNLQPLWAIDNIKKGNRC